MVECSGKGIANVQVSVQCPYDLYITYTNNEGYYLVPVEAVSSANTYTITSEGIAVTTPPPAKGQTITAPNINTCSGGSVGTGSMTCTVNGVTYTFNNCSFTFDSIYFSMVGIYNNNISYSGCCVSGDNFICNANSFNFSFDKSAITTGKYSLGGTYNSDIFILNTYVSGNILCELTPQNSSYFMITSVTSSIVTGYYNAMYNCTSFLSHPDSVAISGTFTAVKQY